MSAILVTLFFSSFFFSLSSSLQIYQIQKISLFSTRKICEWILFLFVAESPWLQPATTESTTPPPSVLFGLVFSFFKLKPSLASACIYATTAGSASHWHHRKSPPLVVADFPLSFLQVSFLSYFSFCFSFCLPFSIHWLSIYFAQKMLFFSILHTYFYKTPTSVYLFYTFIQ